MKISNKRCLLALLFSLYAGCSTVEPSAGPRVGSDAPGDGVGEVSEELRVGPLPSFGYRTDWVRTIAGPTFAPGPFREGLKLAVDIAGNVVVAGAFGGRVDFGPQSFDGPGLFVAKYSPSGALVWARRYLGAGLRGLAVDGVGSVYLTGRTLPTSFGGAPVEGPVYVAKLSPSGGHVFSFAFGDPEVVVGSDAIAADVLGNFVVAGFSESTVDFGNGVTVNPRSRPFIVRFDRFGRAQWADAFRGPPFDQGVVDTRIDIFGRYVAVGEHEGTEFRSFSAPRIGQTASFVLGLRNSGDVRFGRSFGVSGGGGDSLFIHDLALDLHGNVYVSGASTGSYDFGGGLLSAGEFVASFSPEGVHRWSRCVGGAGFLAVDLRGQLFVLSRMQFTVDFGNGPRTSAGGFDVALARYDARDGRFHDVRTYGTATDQLPQGVGTDAHGRVVFGASYVGAFDSSLPASTVPGPRGYVVVKVRP
jgi:hypothetical protein